MTVSKRRSKWWLTDDKGGVMHLEKDRKRYVPMCGNLWFWFYSKQRHLYVHRMKAKPTGLTMCAECLEKDKSDYI